MAPPCSPTFDEKVLHTRLPSQQAPQGQDRIGFQLEENLVGEVDKEVVLGQLNF